MPRSESQAPAPQEIELKLALPPESPARLMAHPRLADDPPAIQHPANSYLDTPEGSLASARMALRLRRVDGITLQTLKTAGHGGGGLSTRSEWEWEVSDDGLDLDGLAALPPIRELGSEILTRLEVQLRTDFTRRHWALTQGRSLIEVAVDEGEIVSGQSRAPIRELELELKAGDAEDLWALADELAGSVALRPSDSSKAVRGRALGQGRWPLPDAQTAGDWFHRAMLALDAFHDSGQARFLADARDALTRLAAHPDLAETGPQSLAHTLACGLDNSGQPEPAFGRAALALARYFARRTPLDSGDEREAAADSKKT
ncbi:CYTH domain-containing protein [Vreelandella jeotgali]|uniref:CYTH domain-containing protein n=1 Tax=Vreelandella jeotgali TaxID=553386 RepID=UPI00034B4A2B|nr:CYTH domain-containing protein [Halomonas jeotgali]